MNRWVEKVGKEAREEREKEKRKEEEGKREGEEEREEMKNHRVYSLALTVQHLLLN